MSRKLPVDRVRPQRHELIVAAQGLTERREIEGGEGPPERTAGPQLRIPHRLVLVFVLLASGIVTVGGLYFRSHGRRYRAEVEHQLSAVAELKTSDLAQWRAERLGDASLFLGNAPFSAMVRRVLDNPQDAEARTQLRTWLTRTQTYLAYDRVSLLDSRGAERLAVPEGRTPVSSVIERRVAEVLRSGEVAFQDFYRDEHDERVYLSILAPILEAHGGGRKLGIVALRIDPEKYLYPFVNRWPTPAQTAETLLVRRDGGDALFLNELRFQKHTALTLRIPLASQDVAAVKAVLGQEGVVESRDYRGVPVIAALRAVPGSPWFLVARMDLAEVNAPLRERLWVMVLLVGGMLAAAAAGVWALWRERGVRHLRERYEGERERAWLHDVVAGSLNEVYVFDPETLRFRFANLGACRNLGYTQEELAGLTPLDLKPGSTEEAFRAMLETLRTAGRPVHAVETVHRRKDGSEYPVEVHLQLVDAGGGAVFLAIVTDITERRRAETRIQQLNRLYAVLSNSNRAIVRLREPRALFAEACRIVVETGGFRMAWIGLLDAETNRVRPVAHAGVTAGDLDTLRIASGDGAGGLGPAPSALREGRHEICNDIEHDPGMAAWRDDALARGYRASAAFPLTMKGRTVGIFALYASEPGFFDGEELQLLDRMVADLSFAMEMGWVEEEMRSSQRQLEALSGRLVTVQEEERQATARELHDEIGQLLTGVKLLAESGSSKQALLGVVEELMGRVRSLSIGLRPPMLDTLGLAPTLRWHVDRYTAQTGVRVDVREVGPRRRYSREVETAAFRIVQEALTNVARHAGAQEAALEIEAEDDWLRLRIEDQGSGFDPAAVPAGAGNGIIGMQERARLLGGQVSIDSQPGRGTRVEAELPATDRGATP